MAASTQVDRVRVEAGDGKRSSQPLLHQHGVEIQPFGSLRLFPIALAAEARMESCQLLNPILADSIILYNLYKKHHWLVRGHTFYPLWRCGAMTPRRRSARPTPRRPDLE